MKKWFASVFLVSSYLIFTSGCLSWFARASHVNIRPGAGGVVRVYPPSSPEARAKAVALMTQTCQGKGYRVVREGEEVVGQRTSHSQSTNYQRGNRYYGGGTNTHGSTTTQNLKEWRIHYECKP